MNNRITASLLAPFLLLILISGASAQVQRTFVSGIGNDGNPCTRTAPCRTFGQAISQTNSSGEVYVLDSAGYAAFTVTKPISIVAPPGVTAGISVFSGDGITINAGASDTVILRGLTVNNQGSSGNGVVFNTGSLLHVEGCVINGFSNNSGLSLLAAGAVVEVMDSTLRGSFSGILVQPSSGTLQATIDHVRLEANRGNGLRALEGSQVTVTNSVLSNNAIGLFAESLSGGAVRVNIASSVVSGSAALSGILAEAHSTGAVQATVARCVISSNSNGVQAQSDSSGIATVRISSSTVTGNTVGLFNSGAPALFLSLGDNTVEGNSTNTFGTIGSYTPKWRTLPRSEHQFTALAQRDHMQPGLVLVAQLGPCAQPPRAPAPSPGRPVSSGKPVAIQGKIGAPWLSSEPHPPPCRKDHSYLIPMTGMLRKSAPGAFMWNSICLGSLIIFPV